MTNAYAATKAEKTKYEEDKDIVVSEVYSKGRHRKWTNKRFRQHQPGDEYFGDATNISKLAKVIQ
eukprot:gene10592-12530_t